MMIKAAFLLDSEKDPSAHYRVLSHLDAFERAGIEVYPMIMPRTAPGLRKMFKDIAFFDVTVLQNRLLRPRLFRALRESAKVLGYDCDTPPRPWSVASRLLPFMRKARLEATVQAVDFWTAADGVLLSAAKHDDSRAFTVATPVDTGMYVPSPRREGQVRLGWVGAGGSLGDLEAIMPAVEEATALRPGATLTVVCDEFGRPRPFVRTVRHRPESEHEDIAAFDIGLAPMDERFWSRGSAGPNVAALGACGVPAVYSSVGSNAQVLVDGETGLAASTLPEWKAAIVALIDDADRRSAMGRAARMRVESRYSAAAVIPQWADIIRRAVSVEE